MATTSSEPENSAETPSQPQESTLSPHNPDTPVHKTPSGVPIEMTTLPSDQPVRPPHPERFDTAPEDVPTVDGTGQSHVSEQEPRDNESTTVPAPTTPTNDPETSAESQPLSQSSPSKPSNINTVVASAPPPMKRINSNPETPAIAPAPETPTVSIGPQEGPAILVTLMLTTGSRYSFRVDSKYLKRRNVGSQDDERDPWEISVYTMKELLWRDWRDDWESRPTNPSFIRLIHLGRMLDDKVPMKDCRFNRTTPNVVHMTVRPADVGDEEDHKMNKASNRHDRSDGTGSTGCKCCVIM